MSRLVGERTVRDRLGARDEGRSSWLAVHGFLRPSWWCALVGAWVLVGFSTAVRLPFQYPSEDGNFIDTIAVVSLLVPVAISAGVLAEGPRDLVRGAARSLAPGRFLRLGVHLSVTALAASGIAMISPVPAGVFIGDAVLLAALFALGDSLRGGLGGFALTGTVLVVVTAPRLVPAEFNVFYFPEHAAALAWLILATFVLIAGVFLRRPVLG
jgi:hypothetical protein